MSDCPFCQIVAGEAPATILDEWRETIAIAPLNPVTKGHALVIPRIHVPDFTTHAGITGEVMRHASEFARSHAMYEHCNLITSRGANATQTVFHLHVHLVPRSQGDGLHLPWTEQQRAPEPIPYARGTQDPYGWNVEWPTTT